MSCFYVGEGQTFLDAVPISTAGGDPDDLVAVVDRLISHRICIEHIDFTVNQSLRHHNVRRLVVENKSTPIGIVSQTDLIQVVEEFGWGWGLEE